MIVGGSEGHDSRTVAAFMSVSRSPFLDQLVLRQGSSHRVPDGTGAMAVDDRHVPGVGAGSVIEIAVEHLDGFIDASTS